MASVAVHTAVRVHHQHFSTISANLLSARLRQSHSFTLHAHLQVSNLTLELLSALGVTTAAQHLLLSVQGEHIRKRRKSEAQAIIAAIPHALEHLRFIGRRSAEKEVHIVVGQRRVGRTLLVGIKFVPANRARSDRDEAWVTTAYFVRDAEVRRLLRNGQLRPVRASLA